MIVRTVVLFANVDFYARRPSWIITLKMAVGMKLQMIRVEGKGDD
jgi:hypothetical protein